MTFAHGWGGAPLRPAAAAPPAGRVIYCYSCGSPRPPSERTCGRCGSLLELTPSAEHFGTAYVLNNLDDLVAKGAVGEAVADRLREIFLERLTGRPVAAALAAPATLAPAPEPAPIVPESVAEPATSDGPPPVASPTLPGLFTPERAPNLLLYLGAFLIVVSALIFVNVSRAQISDAVRFVLLLAGTFGFLAAGLVCHRVPRVIEAGRTFLVIGALLVPLDFAAYYLLVTHESPLSSPAVWVLGSLTSAGLYGALTVRDYGRAYAYLFFAAAISVVGGLDALFALRAEWQLLPFALLALAIDFVDERGRGGPIWKLSAPLELPTRLLANAALGLSAIIVLSLAATSGGFARPPDRYALTVTAAVATVYYGTRSQLEISWERWLAVAGPGLIGLTLVYVAQGPVQAYGFAGALLALAYGVAGDVGKLGTPITLPTWLVERARALAYGLVALALVPVTAYWGAPLVGATVELGMALCLAAVATLRARRPAEARPPDLTVFVVIATAALHLGILYLLVGFGVLRSGIAPFAGLVPRELAIAFAPLAVLLGALTALADRQARPLRDSLAIMSLASAALVTALGYSDPPLDTVLAALAAAGVVAGAVAARRPMGLWIAAGFAGVAGLSATRWLNPAEELRPIVIAFDALVLFLPAYHPRVRGNEFARVVREIGLVTAASGVIVGVGYVLGLPLSLSIVQSAVWLATAPAIVVLGALGVAEGLRRRSEQGVLAATLCFLAAVLVVIARFRPDAVEAYTWPTAAYLGLVAWGVARFGTPALRAAFEIAAQVGAALFLMGPTYLRSWATDDQGRGALVLGESLVVLRFASGRALREIAIVALGFQALMIWRGSVSPLAFESTTAAFGAVTVALALAVPRWVPWRLEARSLELAEVCGVLLVLAPPLVRASIGASDALDHGATVLAGGAVGVALGLWAGRRALTSGALAMLTLIGLLALRDTAKTEPYLAATGVAVIALVLAVPRYLPRRLPVEFEWAAEAVGAALILAPALERNLFNVGYAIRAIAESLALLTLGAAAGRRALTLVACVAIALAGIWVMGEPSHREFHGLVMGAYLIPFSLLVVRYAPRNVDPRLLLGIESAGAVLLIVPTLVSGWNAEFFPQTLMVFFEIFLVLAVGIVFHRRWLVAGALAATGLETVRALIDVVNRLPNWALFGASGAILLAIGFGLTLKRDAWNAWSRQVLVWWTRL